MNKAKLSLHNGSLTLLAARPDMGQRELAVTIAHKLYQECPERQVLYFSLEFARKMMYCCCRIPSDSGLCVIDHIFCVEDIHSIVHLLQRSESIGLIVVDYLELLDCLDSELAASVFDSIEKRMQKRYRTLNHCLTCLKLLAKELHIPVLVLAQLSHHVDNREDRRPVIRDLRSCKISEQDPDQIWFLYRDAYYDSKKNPECGELIIAKNRYGALETMEIFYEKQGICSWFSGFTVSYD